MHFQKHLLAANGSLGKDAHPSSYNKNDVCVFLAIILTRRQPVLNLS